jgi:peptidoglycan/LPS O-acetylase OafA/YrhL
MRAVAILAVLYAHAAILYYQHEPPVKFDGVGIFFVLSGYLIGGILLNALNKPQFAFKHLLGFWVNRWLRTLPAYYIVLTFLIAFTNRQSKLWGFNPHDVWRYFLFIQTMFKNSYTFFPESWSLTIEEWFYLLIPIFFFISLKLGFKTKKVVLFWVISVVGFGFLAKLFVYNTTDFTNASAWDDRLRKPTVLRLDSIMFGVAAAYIKYYYPIYWQKLKGNFYWCLGIVFLITGACLFLLTSFLPLSFIGLVSIYLNTAGAFLILPALSGVYTGSGIVYKLTTFLSKISYSVYLINFCVFHIVWQNLEHLQHRVATHWHSLQAVFTAKSYHIFWYFLFSIGGAYILYSVVEKPFMRLRNRIKIV